MIKKLRLPKRRFAISQCQDSFCRPFFPFPDCDRQRFYPVQSGCSKEMHMIRHGNVTTDCPAVAFVQPLPFIEQNIVHGRHCQQWSSFSCANSKEIDRLPCPNESEAFQMPIFTHHETLIIARLLDGSAAIWPGSATPATWVGLKSVAGVADPGHASWFFCFALWRLGVRLFVE